jgi:hypothetical protein
VERLATGAVGRFRLRDRHGLLHWLGMPDGGVSRLGGAVHRRPGVLASLGAPAQSERVRAIELRRVATGLRPAIERADLTGPDLRVTGPAFAEAFDAWVDKLAAHVVQGASVPIGMADTPSGRRSP